MKAAGSPNRPPCAQRGVAALELALTAPIFFLMLFALLEFARELFLFNTLQEVTRQAARAASVTDFTNTVALAQVRRTALFSSDSDRALPLGGGINASNVRIDYLALGAGNVLASVDPASSTPAANIVNCTSTPHGANCIRFVRVRICQAGGSTCTAVPYTPMVSLLAPLVASLTMPLATTLSPAESFGAGPP